MTVVGVDISSRQVNLAWIDEAGRPQRWHQMLGKGDLIDRLQSIHIQWPESPSEICIEYPFTPQRGAIAALMATVGVVTHQAPRYARVSWVKTADLRNAIGAKNNKADAHIQLGVINYMSEFYWGAEASLDDWSPDDLDALVACVGWSRILAKQDVA